MGATRKTYPTQEVLKDEVMENWKDIPGFKGEYQVSDLGRVRSLTRSWNQLSRCRNIYLHTKQGRVLRPGLNAQGYPTVVLGRAHGTATVHSLVCLTFLGSPKEGKECRHKDGKRNTPQLSNLCYGTRSENINDSRNHGTFQKRYQDMRALTPKQEKHVLKLHEKGVSRKEIAKQFGVSINPIRRIIKGLYVNPY